MKKILLSTALVTSTIFAGGFEVNINDKTIELVNSTNLNNESYTIDMRYLRTEEKQAGQSYSYIANVGFKVAEPLENNQNLTLGLGIDALYTNGFRDDNFLAIPFTLFANYKFSQQVSMDLNAKYSPQILSFKEAESYKEARGTLNFSINQSAQAYVGARYIRANFDGNYDLDYDKSMFAGFKFVY